MAVDPEKNDVQFFFDSLEDFIKKMGSRMLLLTKKGTAEASLAYHSGVLKLKVSARQKEIETHYLALGEYLFHQKGKVNSDDEIIKGHFSKIKDLEKEIASLEAEIIQKQTELATEMFSKEEEAESESEAVEAEVLPPPPLKKIKKELKEEK